MFSSYGGWGRPVNTTTIYIKRKVIIVIYRHLHSNNNNSNNFFCTIEKPFTRDSNGKDPGGHCG